MATRTLKKKAEPAPATEWGYARCPHCGLRYPYAIGSGYCPETCGSYECERRRLHPGLARYQRNSCQNN
ncbi:MAG: hypothetical protein WC369_09660 [Dehalococcoidales bacterium]